MRDDGSGMSSSLDDVPPDVKRHVCVAIAHAMGRAVDSFSAHVAFMGRFKSLHECEAFVRVTLANDSTCSAVCLIAGGMNYTSSGAHRDVDANVFVRMHSDRTSINKAVSGIVDLTFVPTCDRACDRVHRHLASVYFVARTFYETRFSPACVRFIDECKLECRRTEVISDTLPCFKPFLVALVARHLFDTDKSAHVKDVLRTLAMMDTISIVVQDAHASSWTWNVSLHSGHDVQLMESHMLSITVGDVHFGKRLGSAALRRGVSFHLLGFTRDDSWICDEYNVPASCRTSRARMSFNINYVDAHYAWSIAIIVRGKHDGSYIAHFCPMHERPSTNAIQTTNATQSKNAVKAWRLDYILAADVRMPYGVHDINTSGTYCDPSARYREDVSTFVRDMIRRYSSGLCLLSRRIDDDAMLAHTEGVCYCHILDLPEQSTFYYSHPSNDDVYVLLSEDTDAFALHMKAWFNVNDVSRLPFARYNQLLKLLDNMAQREHDCMHPPPVVPHVSAGRTFLKLNIESDSVRTAWNAVGPQGETWSVRSMNNAWKRFRDVCDDTVADVSSSCTPAAGSSTCTSPVAHRRRKDVDDVSPPVLTRTSKSRMVYPPLPLDLTFWQL